MAPGDAFSGEPDFVNELGVKWWLDRFLTEYARNPDFAGRTLPDAAVYYVEEPGGHRCRVFVLDGEAEYESERLEDIGVHIDVMKLVLDTKPSPRTARRTLRRT